jgi:AcrR family transcriptional regulator
MARNRFENLEPERREAILAAAADEFAARGYAGAALSRIIDAAGISKGSLYYYFNDKQDLFVTAVEVAMDRLLEAVGGLAIEDLTATSYWETLRQMALRSIALMSRDEWDVRLAMAFPRLRTEPEARDAVRPALEATRTLTTRLLKQGRELGVVRRDLPLELLVEVTMAADDAGDRWLIEHRSQYDADALRRLVEARIDLMRDMLDAEHEGWDR